MKKKLSTGDVALIILFWIAILGAPGWIATLLPLLGVGGSSTEAADIYQGLPTTAESSTANADTNVVCGNGAEGAWTQLIASTANSSRHLILDLNDIAITARLWVDLGTGAGGAETALVSDLTSEDSSAAGSRIHTWSFPMSIPAATRIAIRCYETAAADTIRVNLKVLE